MKLFILLSFLIMSQAQALTCYISYHGPKLSQGGRGMNQSVSHEECQKIAQDTFNSRATATNYSFDKSNQRVVFKSWESQYSRLKMTYIQGDETLKKTFKRNRSDIERKLTKWARSCDVQQCLKDKDEDSCWDECQLDVGFRPGIDVIL